MERRIEETEKALKTLPEILREPYSVIGRDATIQRFNYTYELFWKLMRDYLHSHEGTACNLPNLIILKGVLRERSQDAYC